MSNPNHSSHRTDDHSRAKQIDSNRREKLWRERHPEEYRAQARKKLKVRILSGAASAVMTVKRLRDIGALPELKEQFVKCSDCNSRATQYEHRDYNYPEKVTPVCQSCNIARGAAINRDWDKFPRKKTGPKVGSISPKKGKHYPRNLK